MLRANLELMLRPICRCCAFCCALLMFSTGASPQDERMNQQSVLRVDREAVLAFDMRITPVGPFHTVVSSQATGELWNQPVILPFQTDFIRIHVMVSGPNEAKWKLIFRNSGGEKYDAIDSDSARGEAKDSWSKNIPGKLAIVQLLVTSGAEGLSITIDNAAFPTNLTFPQSIWGTDDRQPIMSVSPRIQHWGAPVARIRIMMLQGEALCTGFLVSTDLLLTNKHCIENENEASSSTADFGYDSPGSTPESFDVSSLVLSNSSASGLDYTLVRLSGNPGLRYGHVTFDVPDPNFKFIDNPSLLVIEHPAGLSKQVSIKDCEVGDLQVVGVQEGLKTDFGHHCDTLGGSSGSPVFDIETGKVVGLHHMGFKAAEVGGVAVRIPANSQEAENQAVYLWRVLQDIGTQSNTVFAEIGKP
jgi:V8-like Glu-specific endopeptidase